MNKIQLQSAISGKKDMISSIVNRMTSASASMEEKLNDQVRTLEDQVEELEAKLAALEKEV